MFNRELLAELLEKAKGNRYIEWYAKESGVSRPYISHLINMKLDKPPKPDIIKKLASAAHNNVSYEQLMSACGYIDEKPFVSSNITLLKGAMTEEEFIKDMAEKLNNMDISESLTPKLLKQLEQGKKEPQLAVVQMLALYAGVNRSFFYRCNTEETLKQEQKDNRYTYDNVNKISTEAIELAKDICRSEINLELLREILNDKNGEKYIKYALLLKRKGVDFGSTP